MILIMRRLVLVSLAAAALLASCTKPEDKQTENSVKVKLVTLNKSTLTLTEGDSFALSATILPEDADDQAVSWSSSDEAVASVSNEGLVLAKKEGKATVTVTTHDGGKTASCAVTVEAQLDPSVTIGATHISCISAVLSGKANLGKTSAADLKMGIMYSKSSGVLPSTSTMIEATDIEAEYYYSIQLTDLEPETTYYYRSYVYQGGQNTYGDTKSFTTKDVMSMFLGSDSEIISPISGRPHSLIDLSDVVCEDGLIVDGIDEGCGFRYGSNPDFLPGKISGRLMDTDPVNDRYDLYADIINLTPSTTYWCSPYIIIDGRLFQGDTTTFTTKSVADLISTNEATEVSPTGAILNGSLDLTDCKYSYMSYGFCYSEGATSSPSTFISSNNLKDGNYSLVLNNLLSGRQYSFAACVRFSSNGSIRYLGEVKSFYTSRVAVDSVSLDKNELSILTGSSSARLQATVWPSIASNKAVTWKSSDETVLKISPSSTTLYLTALKAGTAIVTVTTEDGGKSSACEVHVVDLSETLEANNISPVSATLHARARKDLYYSTATAGIEYSKNADCSSPTRVTSSAIDAEHHYSVDINNLIPGTKYYYRSYIYYSSSYKYGEIKEFITPGVQSMLETFDATEVKATQATLNAKLDLTDVNASSITYGFYWGTSESNLNNNIKGGTYSESAYSAILTGLSHKTQYWYRAYLKLDSKYYYGTVKTFTTAIVPVVSISLDKTQYSFHNIGDTLTLQATVLPADATDKTLEWCSNNPGVATVNGNGIVTAKGNGSATITVKTHGQEITAACTITVAQRVTSVRFNKSALCLNEGVSQNLTTTISPSNAADKSLTWTSSNTSVATVDDNGKVTAVSKGTATVRSTANDGSGKYASCSVTVKRLVSEITLDKTSIILYRGEADAIETVVATVSPSDANNRNITWTSSNTSVASVSSSGVVTGQTPGTTTITAAAQDGSGVKTTCEVEVRQYVTSIKLDTKSLSLVVGENATISVVSVLPENAYEKRYTWSSTDDEIASVDNNGKVMGISKGSATINVKANDGSNVSSSCSVNIKNPCPEGAVDLGLSVYWATSNLTGYFAWGETKRGGTFGWNYYKFGADLSGPFSKYNTDSSYGTVDNKTILDLEDDAAHVTLGGNWRMATEEEWKELLTKCRWTNTSRNNVNGRLVTAPNGNSIFLPANGFCDDHSLSSVQKYGKYGFYWSSSLNMDKPCYGICLEFYQDSYTTILRMQNTLRFWGISVRPVAE